MDLKLSGQRALVTGASKGIGRGIAEAFAREGASVHLVARSAGLLAEVAADIERTQGVRATFTAVDLTAPGGPERAVDEAGDVDILVNNAGDVPFGGLEEVDAAAWRKGWDLKVFAGIDVTRLVYPRLRARGGGVIVSIIGVGGEMTDAAFLCGGSANAALMHVVKSLGGVSPTDGIRVLGVNPGPVATERFLDLLGESAGGPDGARDVLAAYPFGRAATVKEIADLVVVLASPRASYVSGTIVTIDGGLAARTRIV